MYPRLALVSAIVVLLTGCNVAPQAPSTPTPQAILHLKVADGVTPVAALPQSILSLAQQQGFFQKDGLDVEIEDVNGTPAIITGMRAGEIDVGIINSSDVVKLDADKSLELRVIGSPNGRNFWMIVSRDDVATLDDLRGRAYAISRVGSEDHSLALTVMRARGVDPSGVTFLTLGVPTIRVQALIANQIAATTTTVGTWVTIQDQPGLKVLVDQNDFWNTAPLMSNVSAVTLNVDQDKAEALRRYTRAMIETARYYAANKDAWVHDMGAIRTDIPASTLAALWDQFPTAWAVNGQLNLETFQKTSDYLYATPDFKDSAQIQVSDWVDTQYVDEALGQLGVFPGVDDPGRSIPAASAPAR
jgi:NitT/TauT family transport system substrate-binding protein